jgi:hypothetical protein
LGNPKAMRLNSHKQLKLASLFIPMIFLAAGQEAFASGAVEVIVAPVTFGSPTLTYPNAFAGTGLGIQADYFFNDTSFGVNAGALSEGQGQFEWIRGRYYLIGHPQLAGPSSLEDFKVESKSRGLYAEVGLAAYQVTVDLSTTSNTGVITQLQTTTSGVGGVGALGFEQPFIWGTYIGLRADILTSLGSPSPFSVVLMEVTLGVPIPF